MMTSHDESWRARPGAVLGATVALAATIALALHPSRTAHQATAATVEDEPAPSQAHAPEAAPPMSEGEVQQMKERGLALAERGDDEAALELLASVYRARPSDDAVAIAIADASLRERDFRTAEQVIAALSAPEAPEALRVRGALLEQANRLPEALALYERAIPELLVPQRTMEARARVLSWLGRFDDAAAAYGALVADGRSELEQKRRCRVRIAELTAWKKDLDGALAQLSTLLAEDPRHADALLLQGQILEWQGRYAEAKKSYSDVLAFDAGHVEARLRLDKLLWVE